MFRVYQVTFNVLLAVLILSFFFVCFKTILRMPFPWKAKPNVPKFPKIALVLLLVSIAGVGGLTCFMSAHARARLTERLERLSPPYTVTINGNPAPDSSSIIAALKFDDIDAHHSHPTKRIEIRIDDHEGSFMLVLARDSERSSEYWVYSPEDDFTKGLIEGHEIGRMATDTLNNY